MICSVGLIRNCSYQSAADGKSWQVNSGKLAAIQMPLLVMLASKNNVIGCQYFSFLTMFLLRMDSTKL